MAPKRVLIVDDTPDARLLLRVLLESTGSYEVVDEARDGREAIALAAMHQPDLIIVDQMMPGLSGTECVPLLREAASEAAIVLFSAVASSVIAAHATDADGVVEKGDVEALLPCLDEVMARRAASS
jgi:DNA-binding NarL/FixJ family response regulator